MSGSYYLPGRNLVRANVYDAITKMGKLKDVIKDTHGNVSMRDGDMFWIKPSGVEYLKVWEQMLCGVSLDDLSCENRYMPSVDSVHHAAIYKNYPEIKAICHTHSPYAVAYSVIGSMLCYTTEQADYFGGDILWLEYSDLYSWGKDVKLEDNWSQKAVLLGNHGVLTFGKDALEAVKLAAALENIAMKNYFMERHYMDHDLMPTRLKQEEIDKWHKRYTNEYGQ